LTIQLVAAFIAVFTVLQEHPHFSAMLQLLILPTVFFVVATSNYYNFMDGINGIAALTGIVAFLVLFFYTLFFNFSLPIAFSTLSIAIACLGFLPFNFPRATVFMGDVGSILLGFVFAVYVVVLSSNLLDFIVLTSVLFPFYADELVTLFVRLKSGDKILKPHRKHLYQLLANEKKMPHWKVTLLYVFLQIVIVLTVFLIKNTGIINILLLLLLYLFLFARS